MHHKLKSYFGWNRVSIILSLYYDRGGIIKLSYCRYGDLYTEKNVGISGIHTHAGPGGYLQYVVYIVTSLGFVRQSFDALVDGIEKSIIQAHENLRPGSIFLNKGKDWYPLLSGSFFCFLKERLLLESDISFDGCTRYWQMKYSQMLCALKIILRKRRCLFSPSCFLLINSNWQGFLYSWSRFVHMCCTAVLRNCYSHKAN